MDSERMKLAQCTCPQECKRTTAVGFKLQPVQRKVQSGRAHIRVPHKAQDTCTVLQTSGLRSQIIPDHLENPSQCKTVLRKEWV